MGRSWPPCPPSVSYTNAVHNAHTCASLHAHTCTPPSPYRHGVLLPYELSNLPYLLHRLGRVHTLFTHPHPLTKTTSHVTEGDGGALVSLEGFHRGFLKYLIENRFVSLMYHYLDCYRYTHYQQSKMVSLVYPSSTGFLGGSIYKACSLQS